MCIAPLSECVVFAGGGDIVFAISAWALRVHKPEQLKLLTRLLWSGGRSALLWMIMCYRCMRVVNVVGDGDVDGVSPNSNLSLFGRRTFHRC